MNKQENDIKANRTFSTFGFAQITIRPFANLKEALFSQRNDNNSYFAELYFDN